MTLFQICYLIVTNVSAGARWWPSESWASCSCSWGGSDGHLPAAPALPRLQVPVLTCWLWKHRPKELGLPWRVLSWTRLLLQLPPIPSAGATLPLGPWGGWLPQPSCCHRQLKPLNMTAGFQSEIPASNQVNNCTCHIYLLPPIILCCPFWFGHEWLFNIYFLTLVAHNKVIVQLLQP